MKCKHRIIKLEKDDYWVCQGCRMVKRTMW